MFHAHVVESLKRAVHVVSFIKQATKNYSFKQTNSFNPPI